MRKNLIILAIAFLIGSGFGKSIAREGKIVVLETNQGVIEIKLMLEVAPSACENFIGLAEKGYYNGIIFHRYWSI
jgi:hypothetical protein